MHSGTHLNTRLKPDVNQNLNVSTHFGRLTNPNFMKIGSAFFKMLHLHYDREDGRTGRQGDVAHITGAFHQLYINPDQINMKHFN